MTTWNTTPATDDKVDLHLGEPGHPDVHVLCGMWPNQAQVIIGQHDAELRAAAKRGAMPPPAVEAMLARVLAAALRELGWGLVPPTIRRRVRRPAPKKENNRVP